MSAFCPSQPLDDAALRRFAAIREDSRALAASLSAEDQQVQSMPDASPVKWHLAHTTWFFETFLLQPHLAGYTAFDDRFGYLFNSYYDSVGERHARAERGLLTRPSVDEVCAYRAHVDAAMKRLLSQGPDDDVMALVELGLNHEQQHQELILMDIKHAFSRNPLAPTFRSTRPAPLVSEDPLRWTEVPGGLVEIGHDSAGFGFDNEGPRHKVWLEPFLIADRLATCGEWLQFMADGGYDEPRLWLSDGWAEVQRQGWRSPAYWMQGDEDWTVFTLEGTKRVQTAEPVVHVSFFEADAFARWAGRRLPTEAEWEVATASMAAQPGQELRVHPSPARRAGLSQMLDEAWQWTASAYRPYPRYRPADDATGEYNGKFMSGQMVLRGGACITPPGHSRATYRNFFPPSARWAFSGVRLADDV